MTQESEIHKDHVGFEKVKGEIEVMSGKILRNPRWVEKGRALKHGIVEK
jgi:hypothetical protein